MCGSDSVDLLTVHTEASGTVLFRGPFSFALMSPNELIGHAGPLADGAQGRRG
jgi:hypothetical protein